ncbi:hypothetical protein TIFTF001_021925 [Ficus carica]|uniref:CC-NBS-LRR protein n=1 Tax=Ficus carica TaxID=3494 RepID=A0AA88AVA8_FICCA|nr:hypothetical protein TIFTF001_021925 [Ficus carica]
MLDSPVIESGNLQSLAMYSSRTFGKFPSLQSLSLCHILHILQLQGPIEDQGVNPCRHCLRFLPASLSKLTLLDSCIYQDPMPVVKKLPNLRLLRLCNKTYCGFEMVCSAGGFPKLETLQLSSLPSLEKWEIEKDAMPSLERLHIKDIFPNRV